MAPVAAPYTSPSRTFSHVERQPRAIQIGSHSSAPANASHAPSAAGSLAHGPEGCRLAGHLSVRKVPGTRQAFVALKVREVKGEPQQTKLTVFDAEGRFLMDPPYVDVPGTVKYEGLEFTAIPSVYRWD